MVLKTVFSWTLTPVLRLGDDLSDCSHTLPLHYKVSSGQSGLAVKKKRKESMQDNEHN